LDNKVADNIKYFRESNKWTQHQLADILKVSRSVVAKWENGSTTPDLKSLIALSDVFHISIDHLVGRLKLREEILKEFRLIYSLDEEKLKIDDHFFEIMDFFIKNPALKDSFYNMTKLPSRKQKFVKQMFMDIMSNVDKV
jgi:transcriptional regulator with XRE-family HTH domain